MGRRSRGGSKAAVLEFLEAEHAALERAAVLAAAADDEALQKRQSQAAALSATVRQTKSDAADAIASAEHARSVMLHGAKLGDETLAESIWRRRLRTPEVRAKLKAAAELGVAFYDANAAAERTLLAETQSAQALLTKRTAS